MTSSRSSLRTWRHTWIILSRMTSSLRRPYTRYRHRTPLPAPWRQPMTGSETKHFFDTQTELGKKPRERCVTPHIPDSNLLAKCAFTLFCDISSLSEWKKQTLRIGTWNPGVGSRHRGGGTGKEWFSRRTDTTGYPTLYNTIQYRDPRMQGIHKGTAERDSACNW